MLKGKIENMSKFDIFDARFVIIYKHKNGGATMSAEKEKDADMSIEMKKISATLYSRSKEAEICGKKDESDYYCREKGYYKVGEFQAIKKEYAEKIELIIPSLADFVFHKERNQWVCYKMFRGYLHRYLLLQNKDDNNWSMFVFGNDTDMIKQIITQITEEMRRQKGIGR